MQARALARRCPSGSFTILGDLAQAHGLVDPRRLGRAHRAPRPRRCDVPSLSIGYRVPAAGARPRGTAAAAGGTRSRALRCPSAPAWAPRRFPRRGRVPARPVGMCRRATLLETGLTTAVIVPDGWYDDWCAASRAGGARRRRRPRRGLLTTLTLVPASGCKGLEFDAVILVEPAAIAEEALQPPRALYVAMTRCTQSLVVVHPGHLPGGLPATARRRDARGPGSQIHDAGVESLDDPTVDLAELLDRLSSEDLPTGRGTRPQVARRSTDLEGEDPMSPDEHPRTSPALGDGSLPDRHLAARPAQPRPPAEAGLLQAHPHRISGDHLPVPGEPVPVRCQPAPRIGAETASAAPADRPASATRPTPR